MNAKGCLIHSPLVGTATWSRLAPELRARGFDVVVPTLTDDESSDEPFWKQHAGSVARALESVEQPVSLIGHSGAGMLLPAIAQRCKQQIASYVFMDAGIPVDGLSRIELLERELPHVAPQVQQALEQGARVPNWTDESLQATIPDVEMRRQMLAELHPRNKAFYTEPIPVFAGFPDAPAYYLQLSAGYDYSAQEAARHGWKIHKIDAGHFHMLVDAPAVADALLSLLGNTYPQK
jgi:pimeloyl-ACP methyl ester carboxylesterase